MPDHDDDSLGYWARSALGDLADEVRFVLLVLVLVVPPAAVGWFVAGGRGLVVGALVGAALVELWLLSGLWGLARRAWAALRRHRAG